MQLQTQQLEMKRYIMRFIPFRQSELHSNDCRDLKKIWQGERRKGIRAYSVKGAVATFIKHEAARTGEHLVEDYYKIMTCIHE